MRTLITCLALVVIGSSASAAVVGGGAGYNGGAGANGGNNGNNNNNNQVEAPPSVVGQVFDIAVSDGTKVTLQRLQFRNKDCSCEMFAKWSISSVPFTEKAGKGKNVSFEGEVTDKAGNSLQISGSVKEDGSITGEIDVAKKDGADRQTYNFDGGAPGSDGSKNAKKEVEEAKTKSKAKK
jgi:hypothetical protein